jgi:hypothetical protein
MCRGKHCIYKGQYYGRFQIPTEGLRPWIRTMLNYWVQLKILCDTKAWTTLHVSLQVSFAFQMLMPYIECVFILYMAKEGIAF